MTNDLSIPQDSEPRQLSLFDQPIVNADSLPKRIADQFNFPLPEQLHDGKTLYLATAWVAGVSQSKRYRQLWNDLKRDNPKVSALVVPLLYTTKGGNQTSDFADSLTLYRITGYLRANSGVRDRVLEIMSQSTEFVDWAFRNPDLAIVGFQKLSEKKQIPAKQTKEYRRALDSGYSQDDAEDWVAVDEWAKQTRKEWTTEAARRGGNIAHLTNFVTSLATGKRATDWKREMNIKVSPRQYFSPLKKTAIGIVESLSAIRHRRNNSQGDAQLAADILDMSELINWQALQRLEDRDLKLPPPKPEQKALGDGS